MSKDQFVAATEPKLDEIIRQAESRLAAQLKLATAADQRAMTFASVAATATAALIAWAVSHTWGDQPLAPVLVLIVGLVASAGCALWAASPVAWEVEGNTPASWIEDIAAGKDDLKSAKAAMASFYAEMIKWNSDRLIINANWLRAAMVVAFIFPVLGGVIALINQT